MPSGKVELLSLELWERAVLGIQELPESAELFAPQAGTEFREPEHVDDWTHDEKLISTANTRLVIFIDSSSLDTFQDFFREKNIEIDSVNEIFPESYLETYRNSVQGKSFGEDFWIGPPWAKPEIAHEKHIVIDPGMAFGTGEHPTTQMCVECIWKNRKLAPQRILDLGSGSGILTLAAGKWIPQAEIWALDTDAHSDGELKKNLALNPELNALRIHGYFGKQGFIDQLGGIQFDWVISNIYGEVLAKLEPQIRSALKPGGLWLATGILDGAARQAFENAAFKNFDCICTHERRDAAGNDSLLWLCYELRSR